MAEDTWSGYSVEWKAEKWVKQTMEEEGKKEKSRAEQYDRGCHLGLYRRHEGKTRWNGQRYDLILVGGIATDKTRAVHCLCPGQ